MKTILLVDDDNQLRVVLCAALVRKGYRVIEATSGTEALEMARRHLPDFIPFLAPFVAPAKWNDTIELHDGDVLKPLSAT